MTNPGEFQFLCWKINELHQTQTELIADACAIRYEYEIKLQHDITLSARHTILVRLRADIAKQLEVQRTRLKNSLNNN